MSISMGNAITFLKKHVGLTAEMTEAQSKEYTIEMIDHFLKVKIKIADTLIAKIAAKKINNGDVVLTHARSLLLF